MERARMVLLAADGLTGAQIADRAGCTEPTVIKWRRQYAGRGLAGLEDAPRPGGPKTVLTEEVVCQILAATVTPPPESLRAQGVTHWSSRRLADWLHQAREISVSHDSITVLWRRFRLQPHRTEGFKFSTDPQLDVITRQAIRRGTFTSVAELTAAISTFIDNWNDHPRPFTWTKDAGEILAKIERAKAKTSALTHH
ncbi:MAG: helix-turn-helix domain-containing protein [Streptosporangiaceae bacterium]